MLIEQIAFIFTKMLFNIATLFLSVVIYDLCVDHVSISFVKRHEIIAHFFLGLMVGVLATFAHYNSLQLTSGLRINVNPILFSLVLIFWGWRPALFGLLCTLMIHIALFPHLSIVDISFIFGYYFLSCLYAFIYQQKFHPFNLEHRKVDLVRCYFFGLGLFLFLLLCMGPFIWSRVTIIERWSIFLFIFILYPATTLLLGTLFFQREQRRVLKNSILNSNVIFNNAFNAVRIGLVFFYEDQLPIFNPYYSNLLGYSAEELESKHWSELMPEAEAVIEKSLDAQLLSGIINKYELETQMITRLGDLIDVKKVVSRFKHPNGSWVVVVCVIDITARKQLLQKVSIREKRFLMALEGGDTGAFYWDVKAGKVHRYIHNAKLFEKIHYGSSLNAQIIDVDQWMELILAPYRPAFYAKLTSYLEGSIDRLTSEFEIHPLQDQPTTRWVYFASSDIERDDHGEAVAFSGIFINITEERKQQAQLRLAASIYAHASEAWVIINNKRDIVDSNAAFTKLSGYTYDDLHLNSLTMFVNELHPSSFYDQLISDINQTGQWTGEIKLYHKNGQILDILLTVSTNYDENKQVKRRVFLLLPIGAQKKAEQQAWHNAHHDSLTDLPNRKYFMMLAKERMTHFDLTTQKYEKDPIIVIYLELDQFKTINDTLGHTIGDKLLVDVSKRLRAVLDQQVTGSDPLLARIGGDEFIMLLSDQSIMIEPLCQLLLDIFTLPFQLNEKQVYSNASIGISRYPEDSDLLETLIHQAEQAMFASKEEGGHQFHYFSSEMQAQAQYRVNLINDLKIAIKEEQFELYYQPIVDLKTDDIYKFEALIRWHHPLRGMVPPFEFISIAEESGLILEIGDWVFKQACRQLKEWRLTYGRVVQVSINKSPIQFKHNINTPARWCAYIEELGVIEPTQLNIEITEGLLLDDDPKVYEILNYYQRAGMEISLDDFGTGYTSLSYIKKFSCDYLKIDRSFIMFIDNDAHDRALCETMIELAHQLNIKVIAEGVETIEQRDCLKQLQCDYIQGYFYSRPLPAAQIAQKYFIESPTQQIIQNGLLS